MDVKDKSMERRRVYGRVSVNAICEESLMERVCERGCVEMHGRRFDWL